MGQKRLTDGAKEADPFTRGAMREQPSAVTHHLVQELNPALLGRSPEDGKGAAQGLERCALQVDKAPWPGMAGALGCLEPQLVLCPRMVDVTEDLRILQEDPSAVGSRAQGREAPRSSTS